MSDERVPVKVVGVHSFKDAAEAELYYTLLENEAKRQTRIYVGQCEAWEISRGLHEKMYERPLTFEAMLTCLAAAGATIQEVYINAVRDETFYALVSLRVGDQVHQIDMRPSDAVNLAIRAKCAILINEKIIGTVAKT